MAGKEAKDASWKDGLQEAGHCPRCGVVIYIRPDKLMADGMPEVVYLCKCRNIPTIQLPPPLPPPSAPPPPLTPWTPWPTITCNHCYCMPSSGLGSGSKRHVACCKCGDRVAAPTTEVWCENNTCRQPMSQQSFTATVSVPSMPMMGGFGTTCSTCAIGRQPGLSG